MFRLVVPAVAAFALAGTQAQAQFAPPYPHHHPYPPPVVVVRPYPPVVVPAPSPPVVVVRPAPAPPVYTLNDFVKCFRPTDGHHKVWIVHPHTNRPVEVCFTLPCGGRLREVEASRHCIEFNYVGARDVKIVFHHNGTVDVRQ